MYQRRLNERLALPFSRYFYFKRDTATDREWKRKAKQRLTPAREIGVYSGYGNEAWNDELLVGAPESETEHQVEALIKDAEPPAVGEEEGASSLKREPVERPIARATEADENGDKKSLNRLLQRSLYLMIRNAEGRWTFPHTRVTGKESLHTVRLVQ